MHRFSDFLHLNGPNFLTPMSCAERIQEFSSEGVQVSLIKKSSDFVFLFFFFFFFFLVLSLFYKKQMVNLKEIYYFSRFQRGSNIYQGGPTVSRGSNSLFRIETHITCDFLGGGGGPDPLSPPLDPHLHVYICTYFRSDAFQAFVFTFAYTMP